MLTDRRAIIVIIILQDHKWWQNCPLFLNSSVCHYRFHTPIPLPRKRMGGWRETSPKLNKIKLIFFGTLSKGLLVFPSPASAGWAIRGRQLTKWLEGLVGRESGEPTGVCCFVSATSCYGYARADLGSQFWRGQRNWISLSYITRKQYHNENKFY